MRTEFLCVSVLRVASGPWVKLASCKSALNPLDGLLYWPFEGGGLGVSLILCCFVVYSTRRFVVCLSMCHFVLVYFSPFSIAITSLWEKRANINAFRTFFVRFSYVCSICACLDLSVSYSSLGLGGAAVCNWGTPWTFLLPFFGGMWQPLESATDPGIFMSSSSLRKHMTLPAI